MLSDRFNDFQEKLNRLVLEHQRLGYMTCGKELQSQACVELDAIRNEAAVLKAEIVEVGDEDSANAMLGFQCAASALIGELKMWIALKEDRAHDAWTCLVAAQHSAEAALRAHPATGELEKYAKRLAAIEAVVFPPQTFTSAGAVITYAECSICGKEYGECEHVMGRAYMGTFCAKIIKNSRVKEVSVVDEPADKGCRITSVENENGVMVDRMTFRPLPADTSRDTAEATKPSSARKQAAGRSFNATAIIVRSGMEDATSMSSANGEQKGEEECQ